MEDYYYIMLQVRNHAVYQRKRDARRIGEIGDADYSLVDFAGRLGVDYDYALSLIPVSYGQRFTGYHR